METKAGLIIFFLLKGWQASSFLKCSSAERKIFCGQNHVLVVLERQVKIRHFRKEKKKAFKNSLKLSLSPSLEEEGSLLFFICFPSCPLKEKGAGGLFLASCPAADARKAISPKSLHAGTAVGTTVCTSHGKIGLGEGLGDQNYYK